MAAELFLTLVRRLTFLFLVILLLAMATRAHGQNAGVVGIATQEITVFTAQSTTLSSGGTWQCSGSAAVACPVLPDLGAAANFLSYCNSGFTGTIDLEWSPTGIAGPFLILTQATYSGTTDSACHTLQVGGYFPNLRSTVTPTAGSLSAWYTASAAPIPLVSSGIGSNGPSAPVNCDRTATQSVATGGTTRITAVGPINSGDTVVICGFSLSFDAATISGTVGLVWSNGIGCSSPSVSWQMYTTANTPQTLPLPIQERGPTLIQQSLCLQNSSGANAQLSVSYASVHGL